MDSTPSPRRIAFFGGQGCRSLFSKETSQTALENASSSLTASWLLSTCYHAFQDELSDAKNGLGKNMSVEIIDELTTLSTPEGLLDPSTSHHNNPIIQGVSLLVHQLLNYLIYLESRTTDRECGQSFIKDELAGWDEVVGFCSGILPSVVVAGSRTIQDYVEASKQAVRLAFWIGYRAAIFCETLAGPEWRSHSWTIALGGFDLNHVNHFNEKQTSDSGRKVRLSARVSPNTITVSGTAASLEAFKTFHGIPDTSAEVISVNALYHGGQPSEPVVKEVLEDVTRRRISLLVDQKLYIPIRSTVDGAILSMSNKSQSLTEMAIRTILVETLDWHTTWKNISQFCNDEAAPSILSRNEVHAFGPHSRTFFSRARNRPNLEIMDHSRTKNHPIQDAIDTSIAVVGMSINFPGASDKETLWRNLEKGVNTVQTIPTARFDASELGGKAREDTSSRRLVSQYGNFIDKPFAFDHSFFDISPREAKSMDPQQKLLLQASLHALEDAGYVPDATPTFQRESFGCYVGIATGDYVDNLRNDIDVYYSTGTLRAFLSGKISFANKFSGPSVVVDTACSASSVAIYQACRALVNGDCNAALAGGANAITSPDMCIGLGRAHFLSPTGQCKSFDASADGYCRSEGCGIFVLKRLKDALAENDRVYGIIRGISVNHCGNASSITHPHVETQQKLFKSVLTKAQIDPSSIGVVEAHGTGTQAGDAVEIASIESVFGTSDRDVYITSIKANIGHLEAASGAASLAKVLLMLKNKRIPQQPALKQINPRLAAVMSKNMQITTDGADWKQDPNGQPRRAMINNFGAAGSNAAMIVEEHFLNVSGISQVTSRSVYPFRVSARTSKAVMSLCSQYLLSLRASGTHTHLRDVCYTAIARRRQYEHHFTVVCKGLDDLIRKLQEPTITQKQSKHKPIVFVFSGQGGAYHGMGRELLATSPTFRESVDACEQLLRDMGFPSVRRMLLGTCNSEEARDTYMSQTSIFVLQYALAKLWSSFGVEPHCIIGHSLGEYAVMVIAGVLSLADGLRLVATRATLIKELCPRDRTGMLACTLGTKEALRIVSDHHESCPDLQIACQNTTEDSVIAGPMEQLQAFAEVCKGEGRRCKLLDVPFGFHSSALDPILNEFEKVTAAATYSSPNVRVGSTVCGEFLPSHGIDSQYFIRQTRSTVRFAQLLQTIAEDEELVSACFIEIGPSPMTLPMIRRSLNTPGDYEYLGSLSGKEDAWETLSSSLTQLDSEYCAVNWRRVFDGSGARVMDVPSYPLEQTELYVQYREPAKEKPDETKRGESPGTGLLSRRLCGIEKDDTHDITFETNVETLGPYIKGHLVGGVALCPASIYHEMAVEAVTFGRVIEDNVPVITDLTFEGPLVYSDADARIVRLRMDQQPNVHSRKSTSFRFSSYSPKHSDQIKTHCSGHLTLEYTGNVKKHFARKIAMIKRQLSHLESRRDVSDIFHTKILYETIFPRVVLYAPSYRTIQQLTVTDTGLEGHGIFQLPPAAIREGCVLSPTFFDTLLHGAGFIANSRSDSSEAYICVKVETSKILFNEIDQKAKYSIYCSLLDCIENTLVADSYAVAADGTLVAAVEGIHFKKLNLRSFQSHLSLQQMAVNPPKLRPHSVSSSTVCSEDDDEEEISDSASSISTPSVSSKTDISAQGRGLVVRTISEVCGVHPDSCQSSRSLNELGVDSLMSIEICSSLKRHLPGLDMDGSTLMELNTIGKLSEHIEKITDRDQCPKIMSPDQRQTTSRQISPKRTTQAGSLQRNNSRFPEYKQVESRLKEVCGISHASLRPDSTLGSLGLDSLLSLEVRESFKKEFAIDIAAEQLHSDLTVHELFKTVTKSATPALKPGPRQCSPSNVKTQSAKLLLLQKGDKGSVPLVLFHDGSGSFAAYSKLDEVPFPVYGVANPSLGASKAWAPSIEGMAEEYADAIRSKIGGPVIVGGWSFGGILAFEVAQRLGKHVKGVVLIDSPSPIDHAPLPDAVIDYVLQDLDPKSKRTLGVQFRSHAAILSKYNPQQDRSGAKFALLPSQETINTTKLCGVGYPWLEHGSAQAEAILEWESLIRNEVRILPIPGNHFEPFRGENVHTTTEMLIDAYEYVMRS